MCALRAAARHGVQQTIGEHLLRRDRAPAHDDLKRARERRRMSGFFEQPRQSLCATVPRQQVQSHLGLSEARERLGHTDMAGHRELHATAERDAVDGGDGGLVHRLDLAEREVRVVRQRQRLLERVHILEQLTDIGAGDERR